MTAFVLAGVACETVLAALQVGNKDMPARVFAGEGRTLAVQIHNPADQDSDADISLRLLQTTSGTFVPLSVAPWKRLRVLARQTVVETAVVTFPAVKAETRFLVQWIEATNHVLGTTEVFVFPTNLLVRLKTLAGGDPLGVFDPEDYLKPLIHDLGVEFVDMQEDGTDKYHGKLAVFGPFESKVHMRASLKEDIRALARRGVAVVWLQPPPDRRGPFKPSFYAVSEGEETIIVAAHELIAGLAERPEAQLNLLRLAEHALHPTPLTLPEAETTN